MKKNIRKILIICTGNSCRSVMADGYLTRRTREMGLNPAIISAGTGTLHGFRPTDETVKIMKEHGIDVSGYTSSPLNKPAADAADIILIMEPHHKEKILNLSPNTGDKIHYLREFSSEKNRKNNTIRDPIGEPIEFYREIFEIIKESVEGFIKWLKE